MAYSLTLYNWDCKLILSLLILAVWIAVLGLYLISLIYAKIHLHRPKKQNEEEALELPGVTIIKPLNSLADPNLVDNLSTYFSLNYPTFEIIFCIQDEEQSELIKVIRGLMAKYPDVDASIYIGAQNVGVNPKVNNMMNGYKAAKHPVVLISDAGIRMNEDTLTDMALHMTDRVGLVHQLPNMMDGDLHFSRVVEKVWFGGVHARVYLSANAVGLNCMTSMSCMFRKRILDEEGGLSTLGCYLGEDFFLGQLIASKGWKIVISSQPTLQNPGHSSINAFKSRMMRWMYMRFAAMPHMVLLEPLVEHIFLAPLSSLAVQYIFSVPFYIFLPAHLLAWCIMDYLLLSVIENRKPSYSLCSHTKAWLVREMLVIYLYLNVLTMRYVSWGGQKFLVHFGGKTDRVNGDSHKRLINI